MAAEPTKDFLDTLVQLAQLGTSGLSIFAIFWVGWLVSRKDETKSHEAQKNIRFFMIFCLAIFLISVLATIFTGKGGTAEKDAIIARYEDANRPITIIGDVKPADGSPCPGGIVFNLEYPDPTIEQGTGRIMSLKIRRNADGTLPTIGLSGQRIFQTRLDLETEAASSGFTLTNNTLKLNHPISVQLKPQNASPGVVL